MNDTEINFQTFFAAKIKDRGASVKKLAEATGITSVHLEALAHGRFEDLPSAPYVHGYIVRLGKVLDFDGEAWWEKLKKEDVVQNSGSTDALPSNRFIKQTHAKFIWAGIAAAAIIIYLAFQVPVIFGRPSIVVNFPAQTPYSTSSSTLIIQGIAHGADSLTLVSPPSLNVESITIAPDGSWEKSVLLQNGPNTFQITAKKILGGETSVTEQIIYEGQGLPFPPGAATSTASSTASSIAPAKPSVHFYKPSQVPTTGTFYQ